MEENADIRGEIKRARVHYWEVAQKLGVSDATLTRRLRRRLSTAEKTEIMNAIDQLRLRG